MRESWHAVTIRIKAEDVEIASHLLHEAGCNGIVEEPANGDAPALITAYFNATDEEQSALALRIREAFAPFPSIAGIDIAIVTSAANEWQENWRQWFRPFSIVPGIVVAPSWEQYAPRDGESVITLDPGMAFGTGLHQTTKLCAEAIYKTVGILKHQEKGRRLDSLLDVGTGSGLLAIIARNLGFEKIAAVENDPDALMVARENFEINKISGVATHASLDEVKDAFDLVVANILLLTLVELRDKLIAATAPGGTLILSGITGDQEARIAEAFGACEVIAREAGYQVLRAALPR